MRRMLAGLSVVFLGLLLEGCGVTVIEDGQAGIKADFGKIAQGASLSCRIEVALPIIYIG